MSTGVVVTTTAPIEPSGADAVLMNIGFLLPEAFLLVAACVVAVWSVLAAPGRQHRVYWLAQFSLLLTLVFNLLFFQLGQTVYALSYLFVSDPMGHLLKAAATLAVMVTLVYARPYSAQRDIPSGELNTLAMFALLGMMVMISGNNFLVIYLGLELLTLTSYALVALRRDNAQATEAAMKYFVLGALASGFLLYGLSMMYGATGSLELADVYKAVASGQVNKQVLVFGLVFIVAGLAFKLGVVPFHMWVPDVYHGAPTAATLMIAGAPKLAAFAIVIRLLVEGLLPRAAEWQQMLGVLAVASLLIGNLAAIAQTNLKRMLAYSTIAQMGFMLLALLSGVVNNNTFSGPNAYSAGLFYVITYVLTTLGSFGVILLLAREGVEADEIDDLRGLNQRSPLYAAVMAVCLFSLAGIPPTVGFYAKFAVLQTLVAANQPVYLALAIFAVLVSLVAAFYYLRVVKAMYFDAPRDEAPFAAGADMRAVLSLNGAAVLLLGLVPGGLMALCESAIRLTLVSN
jgi:NADH-quinone oxidoreductase subunit N